MPEMPKVTAFLVCEFVAKDERSGRHHLIGTFDHVVAGEYPTVLAGFAVYMNFTNMKGTYELAIQLIHGRTLAVLGEIEGGQPLVVDDPLVRTEFGVNFDAGTVIPEPGRYLIRLLANGQEVQDFALDAVTIEVGDE